MARLAVFIAIEQLGNAEAHLGRDLFRLAEIDAGNFLQRGAVKRHDALVALHMRALIDGEGQNAIAQQMLRLGQAVFLGNLQGLFIVAGIGAHPVRRREIGDDQIDRGHCSWSG